ncbi:MAG: septal ring lytic transglycosylase RlpA family protein [Burkholderiaceae bacterium]
MRNNQTPNVRRAGLWLTAVFTLLLAACSSPMPKDTRDTRTDSGPPAGSRPDLDAIPDAVPKAEPIIASGPNRQYVANGVTYMPDISNRPYQQRGLASWYGEKYHGNRTSNGEVYDMYAMTAAHTTLPLPSYARVTHLGNGKSVVVRVNDRGPFAGGRIIDLSYAAAHRLGMITAGQAEVMVERVFAADAPVSPFPSSAATAPVATPRAAPSTPPPPSAAAAPPLSTERPRNIAPPTGKGMMLQAGSFSTSENAQKMANQIRTALPALADRIGVEMALVKGKTLFRVMVGAFNSDAERSSAASQIQKVTGSLPANR